MDVALRSYLSAGAAAAVVAGSAGMTPVDYRTTPSIDGPHAAHVALAGLDSPLTELLATVSVVNNDIFNGADIYGDYEWEPYQGLIPQFAYDALPILTQLVYNNSAYIGGTVAALTVSGTIISDAIWNLPSAAVTAVGQVISGDISGAVTTLSNATLVPLQDAAATLVGTASAILTEVNYNVSTLAAAVPGIVQGLATTTVGSLSAVVNAAVTIATQTLTALSTLDFQTAWNVVVDGLLGPVGADGTVASSLPGTIEAVTIGPGLVPLGNPDGYAVPSVRMWAEQSNLQIANAIGASYPVPAASARRAGRPAAAVAVHRGQAVTADTTPSTAKTAKHRASRKSTRTG